MDALTTCNKQVFCDLMSGCIRDKGTTDARLPGEKRHQRS